MTAVPDATERARRTEYVRESKSALQNGETIDGRARKREGRADEWALWIRQRMDEGGSTDPVEILPDALAKLEQIAEDRAAAAIREIKAALRKALT
jgi:hypothetical protein